MATWREWRAWCREFKSLGIRQVKEREARSIWHPREAAGGAVVAARAGAAPLRYHRARTQAKLGGGIDSRARQRWAFITGVAHHDDRDLFWWIGLSIVAGRTPCYHRFEASNSVMMRRAAPTQASARITASCCLAPSATAPAMSSRRRSAR